MGFIKRMILEELGAKAVDIYDEHKRNTSGVSALVNKSNSQYNNTLIIEKKTIALNRSFVISDENRKKKYKVKTNSFTFGHPSMSLLDMKDHEIGKVVFASKWGKDSYSLYLEGEKIGALTLKSLSKYRLELNNSFMFVAGNFMQNRFHVEDSSGSEIMQFSEAYSGVDTYVLGIKYKEHEIIGIMIVMAIDLEQSKN